ncbi:MAG: hypothetical protein DI596_11445 [Azospira oryzae]|nr:MAG: hypothetical protein DI596_11445 [Azospira oryzae]PZP77942.1 MAG: hypothetical protein DI593_11445 [Azospira oryzae]
MGLDPAYGPDSNATLRAIGRDDRPCRPLCNLRQAYQFMHAAACEHRKFHLGHHPGLVAT